MNMMTITGLAIVAVALGTVLKQKNPEYSLLLSLTAGVLILGMIIISTTISPARVVIIACSSRPERISTWLRTATMIPIAAILKIKSTSIIFHRPFPPNLSFAL